MSATRLRKLEIEVIDKTKKLHKLAQKRRDLLDDIQILKEELSNAKDSIKVIKASKTSLEFVSKKPKSGKFLRAQATIGSEQTTRGRNGKKKKKKKSKK